MAGGDDSAASTRKRKRTSEARSTRGTKKKSKNEADTAKPAELQVSAATSPIVLVTPPPPLVEGKAAAGAYEDEHQVGEHLVADSGESAEDGEQQGDKKLQQKKKAKRKSVAEGELPKQTASATNEGDTSTKDEPGHGEATTAENDERGGLQAQEEQDPSADGTTKLKEDKKKRKKRRKSAVSEHVRSEIAPAVLLSTIETSTPRTAEAQPALKKKNKNTELAEDAIPETVVDKVSALLKSINDEKKHNARTKMILHHSEDNDEPIENGTRRTRQKWEMSEPVGGVFLDTEPAFFEDERHVAVASSRAVQIYSVATSLLVRAAPAPPNTTVTCYAVSLAHPDSLYYVIGSTTETVVVLWDWQKERTLGQWALDLRVTDVQVSKEEGSNTDTLFTLGRSTTTKLKQDLITAHRLSTSKDSSKNAIVMVHKSDDKIAGFQVFPGAQALVVHTTSAVRVGSLERQKKGAIDGLHYNWVELSTPVAITSCHARLDAEKVSTSTKQRAISAVDVVAGGVNGALFVYEDVGRSIVSGSARGLNPRTLHWHREAVGSVKWSLDGNYLISGGRETVLCIWQVNTGKRQDLPHLPAAIEAIVVSPKGSSYALRLADNSIIALSTAELKATTSIAGLQTQYTDLSQRTPEQLIETVRSRDQPDTQYESLRRSPAVLDPKQSNRLLVAVPASVPRKEHNTAALPAPYLQTYDFVQARHVARQALTRNNATTFINNPTAERIQEPDVRFVAISHDGQWLATLEEWTPPKSDVKFLSTGRSGVLEQRATRLESYLKFWSWNAEKEDGTWQLETRIDSPHMLGDGLTPARVFSLVADPSGHGFATIGADGFVRSWTPKTRLRDGVVVRGATGQGLVTWSIRHAIELDSHVDASELEHDFPSTSEPSHGCLAYSEDGSVLVATLAKPEKHVTPTIQFISAGTGEVKSSLPGVYKTGLIAVGLLDRYLIVLSDHLTVWDVVSNEYVFGLGLRDQHERLSPLRTEINHLAINHTASTFAVAIATKRKEQAAKTKALVFSATSPDPIWHGRISSPVTALMAVPGAKGYTALTSKAELIVIGPSTGALPIPSLSSAIAAQNAATSTANGAETIVSSITDNDSTALILQTTIGADATETDIQQELDENDRPVVRPQQLARVFETGLGFALPPVSQLFEAVVGLYARKPRVAAQA